MVAHLERAETLALGLERLEGVAVDLSKDGCLAAQAFGEGHTDITNLRGVGIRTIIKDILRYVNGAVLGHLRRKFYGSVAGNGVDEGSRKFVTAE